MRSSFVHSILLSLSLGAHASTLVVTETSYVTVTPTITSSHDHPEQLPYCYYVDFLLGDSIFGPEFTLDPMSQPSTSTIVETTTGEGEARTKTISTTSTVMKTVYETDTVTRTAPITVVEVSETV